MKKNRLASIALGATMLAAPFASAGEPQSVEQALKQIRAHKKAKKEAQAKAKARQSEIYKKMWSRSNYGDQGGQGGQGGQGSR